jgi:hypothetical protein
LDADGAALLYGDGATLLDSVGAAFPNGDFLGSFFSRTAAANSGQQRTLPTQILLLPLCFNTNNNAARNWGLLLMVLC